MGRKFETIFNLFRDAYFLKTIVFIITIFLAEQIKRPENLDEIKPQKVRQKLLLCIEYSCTYAETKA